MNVRSLMVRWSTWCSLVLLVAACDPAMEPPKDPDPGWVHLSGETFVGCNPGETCDWTGVGNLEVRDFAFDGDDVLIVGDKINTRLSLATGKGSYLPNVNRGPDTQLEVLPQGIFAKGNSETIVMVFDRSGTQLGAWGSVNADLRYDCALRLTPDGHLLTVGPPMTSLTSGILVEIDPAVSPDVVERTLTDWDAVNKHSLAVDEAGRVYYDVGVPLAGRVEFNVFDRATGRITRVTAVPNPDNGQVAFLRGTLLGTAPGGGVLALRTAQTGMDVVRLLPTGETSLVMHSELALSTAKRLRARDGYLYVGGMGLWRTKDRVF